MFSFSIFLLQFFCFRRKFQAKASVEEVQGDQNRIDKEREEEEKEESREKGRKEGWKEKGKKDEERSVYNVYSEHISILYTSEHLQKAKRQGKVRGFSHKLRLLKYFPACVQNYGV